MEVMKQLVIGYHPCNPPNVFSYLLAVQFWKEGHQIVSSKLNIEHRRREWVLAYLPIRGSSPMVDLFLSIGPGKVVFWAHLVMCSLGVRAGRSQILKGSPFYKVRVGHFYEESTSRVEGAPSKESSTGSLIFREQHWDLGGSTYLRSCVKNIGLHTSFCCCPSCFVDVLHSIPKIPYYWTLLCLWPRPLSLSHVLGSFFQPSDCCTLPSS